VESGWLDDIMNW